MSKKHTDKVEVLRIIFHNKFHLHQYFTPDNMELLLDILHGIESGVKSNLNAVDIFEIEVKKSRSLILFSLNIEEWADVLKSVMNHFAELEEYEHAATAQELIGRVTSRLSETSKENV
jgi:hypothetical protein